MRRRIVIGLALFVAVAGLTCAPRDETPSKLDKLVVENGIKVPQFHPDDLKARIESALDQIKQRKLEPDDGFWTVFHAILGMGFDTELVLKDKVGHKRVKAIEYIFDGKPMKGLEGGFLINEHGLDVKI